MTDEELKIEALRAQLSSERANSDMVLQIAERMLVGVHMHLRVWLQDSQAGAPKVQNASAALGSCADAVEQLRSWMVAIALTRAQNDAATARPADSAGPLLQQGTVEEGGLVEREIAVLH